MKASSENLTLYERWNAVNMAYSLSNNIFSPPEMGRHLIKHGDGVKDIAFQVEDCDFLVKVTGKSLQNWCCADGFSHTLDWICHIAGSIETVT